MAIVYIKLPTYMYMYVHVSTYLPTYLLTLKYWLETQTIALGQDVQASRVSVPLPLVSSPLGPSSHSSQTRPKISQLGQLS